MKTDADIAHRPHSRPGREYICKQPKLSNKQQKELGLIEKDPDVVGYVLFNTRSRRFATMDENEFGMVMYADDLEEAYLAPLRLDALMNIDFLPGSDQNDNDTRPSCCLNPLPKRQQPLANLTSSIHDKFFNLTCKKTTLSNSSTVSIAKIEI
ncbi:hypothetical protein [Photorhabdus laumondii]|uniref:hypothetical protein n=1 Tax=Photorhabdus laumondii TaxID=2218628 RepID=UPI0003217939|nr:hypothetical protein [Photorhabdus laumondii]AWK42172.1 hypothetical protein A4R40_12040 [Photorhabdus laumondii subsp. laumondii]